MTVLAVQSPRKTVLTLFLVFVVMAAGVTAGIYLATTFGFVTWAKQVTLEPVDLKNSTGLQLGDEFPSCPVVDADGNTVEVRQLVGEGNVIFVFVSNGCEACEEFLSAARSGQIVPDNGRLVLLTMEPEYFAANYSYPSYGIDQRFLDEQAIFTSPTIIAVDKTNQIKVICSEFTELLTRDFMEHAF